ncbi:hypothetical protein CAP39_12760 [Sphingomonas sp. IBVSS1]|nr:hypothetical protein CAP39_12760 [Sphingomonas sp. IBVSS1]
MIDRRLMLALPLLAALTPAFAQPANSMAAAIAAGWTARGVRFTADQVATRMAGRTGKAALLALAGATEGADGDEVETIIEIVWDAGTQGPSWPLLLRDLAAGLPGVLQDQAGDWWLLTAHDNGRFTVRHPLTGETRMLAAPTVQLIGRPLIAGA